MFNYMCFIICAPTCSMDFLNYNIEIRNVRSLLVFFPNCICQVFFLKCFQKSLSNIRPGYFLLWMLQDCLLETCIRLAEVRGGPLKATRLGVVLKKNPARTEWQIWVKWTTFEGTFRVREGFFVHHCLICLGVRYRIGNWWLAIFTVKFPIKSRAKLPFVLRWWSL